MFTRKNCFHVENMKQLFQDIHIDSIDIFKTTKNFFYKIMFCFTFVSDHNVVFCSVKEHVQLSE